MSATNPPRTQLSKQKAAAKPTELPLGKIYVDKKTFQWRVPQYSKVEGDAHIRTLTRAIKDTGGPLDPLVVFSVGERFVVIDGHHRLDAYRKARWKKPIPVTVFEGTLEQARLAALTGNTRDKLRLSGPEKREAAWKLVKEKKTQQSADRKIGGSVRGYR